MSSLDHRANREALFGERLSGVKEEDSQSRSSNNVQREQQLQQARREMQVELEKLRSAEAVVTNTSSTISSIDSKYGVYQERLASASRTLKTLKTKLEKDDRYIYWSYMIFLLSAGWIFLRRVKLVALAQWLASKGFNTASWVVDQVSLDSIDSPTRDSSAPISTSHYPTTTAMTTVPRAPELTVSTTKPVDQEKRLYTTTMVPESRPSDELEAVYVETPTTTTRPIIPEDISLTTQRVIDEVPTRDQIILTTHRPIEIMSTPPFVPTTSPPKDKF